MKPLRLPANEILLVSCQRFVIVLILFIGLCLSASAQPFRIVVAGDGRAEYPWKEKRPDDLGGLNVTINQEICKAVLDEKPQLMLWTGDFVNVNERAGEKDEQKTCALRSGLKMWREIMDPLLKHHIKVLPVRGNHEAQWYKEKDFNPIDISNAVPVWRDVLSNLLPNNDQQDEEGLSFWYAEGPVLCIGLDNYGKPPHSVNNRWLDDVLAKNKAALKKPFIFAFGHEPAFATGGPHDRKETLAVNPISRDSMLQSLWKARAGVYFCGHDHFYDHMKAISKDMSPPITIHQVTAGTAGAPMYSHKTDYPPEKDWALEKVKARDGYYGYILVTIDGNEATIDFKGRQLNGEYQVMDSFSYSPPSGP